MEKYGFVYIWYDRKHKRFYIGSHWGYVDDGYVCSSSWMKKAYKLRPNDFKRKIISKITSNRQDLLIEEHKWLSKIKDHEIGTKYYNLTNHLNGHWSSTDSKMTIQEKLKKSHWSRSENSEKIKETLRKKHWKNSDKADILKESIKNKLTRIPLSYTRSEETRSKISENSKRLQAEKKIGMHGRVHSDATKEKMALNNAMKSEENRRKIGMKNSGTKCLFKDGIKKMAKPGSEKWIQLIEQGFIPNV